MTEHLERELKLSADGSFRLPELPGTALPERTFTSTYYDTPEHRLARSGVTLRRRVENRRGLWQLKLPRGADRLELELPGPPSEVPSEMAELLAAYARGHTLEPVAVLRTKRSGIRTDAATGAVAEVTIDVVSVMADRKIVRSFRELEVELVEGDEKGLEKLGKALRAAGAEEGDGRPKLFQALDLERAGGAHGTWSQSVPGGAAASDARGPVPGRRRARSRNAARPRSRGAPRYARGHEAVAGRSCERVAHCSTPTGRRRCGSSSVGWAGCWARCGTWTCSSPTCATTRTPSIPASGASWEGSFTSSKTRAGRLALAMLEALASDRYMTLLDRLEEAVAEPEARPRSAAAAGHRGPGVPQAAEGGTDARTGPAGRRSARGCASAASGRATRPSSPSP